MKHTMPAPTMPPYVRAWAQTGLDVWYGCTYEKSETPHPRDTEGQPVSIDGVSPCAQTWNTNQNGIPDPSDPAYLTGLLDQLDLKNLEVRFVPEFQIRDGTVVRRGITARVLHHKGRWNGFGKSRVEALINAIANMTTSPIPAA